MTVDDRRTNGKTTRVIVEGGDVDRRNFRMNSEYYNWRKSSQKYMILGFISATAVRTHAETTHERVHTTQNSTLKNDGNFRALLICPHRRTCGVLRERDDITNVPSLKQRMMRDYAAKQYIILYLLQKCYTLFYTRVFYVHSFDFATSKRLSVLENNNEN